MKSKSGQRPRYTPESSSDAAAASSPAYSSRHGSHRERPLVLVVEDSIEMNRLIARDLAMNYRVAVAFDGQEGLRLASELRPDLILTDVTMPVMSGEELVLRAHADPELSSIPIVVL